MPSDTVIIREINTPFNCNIRLAPPPKKCGVFYISLLFESIPLKFHQNMVKEAAAGEWNHLTKLMFSSILYGQGEKGRVALYLSNSENCRDGVDSEDDIT